MQRKVLPALVVSVFLLMALSPALVSDDSDAISEVPKPYPDNPTKFHTFQGIAKYEDHYIPADKLTDTRVVIVAAYWNAEDNMYYYTEMPAFGKILSAEDVEASESTVDFSVTIPKISDMDMHNFQYYLCVENGFKITGVSDSRCNDIPVKIHPFPYVNVPGAEAPWGTDRMPVYNAYMIKPDVYKYKPDPVNVTSTSSESGGIITLTPATVNISGSVMSGKFALANVNIDLCNISTPDRSEYTAITNKDGQFSILNVRTGTYIVKAYTNGYTADEAVFNVVDGEVNTLDISMEQNSTGYFGYDMPHFLLILGGVIGVILIVASLFFQYWVVRKKHDNWVYNDMEDKDQEE